MNERHPQISPSSFTPLTNGYKTLGQKNIGRTRHVTRLGARLYWLYCAARLTARRGTLTRYLRAPVGARCRARTSGLTVPMLPNKPDDEPMVTKKKSKIPCLSLSSFLPALEGTVHSDDLYSWPRRHPPVTFTRLVALTFLSKSGVM